MKEKAIKILESQGNKAAITFLQTGEANQSPADQVEMFDQVLRHAYWQLKDLPATIEIGQAGISLGEKLASSHPDQEEEIQSQIKAIHYNLASFTWPGWDEPGFEISEDQVSLGLESAKQNLSLAQALKKDALPLSRAYWILAGHEMAAKDYHLAKENFYHAEQLARQAGSEGEALLSHGFAVLAQLLANPGSASLLNKLAETKTALKEDEHGEFFIKQLEDAQRVFSG